MKNKVLFFSILVFLVMGTLLGWIYRQRFSMLPIKSPSVNAACPVNHPLQTGMLIFTVFLLMITSYGIIKKHKALQGEKRKLKVANQQLREREELFRTIYEQAPIGISFGNARGEHMDFNPMYEKITGRSKEELAVVGWTGLTHPEDRVADLEQFTKFTTGDIDGYSMQKRCLKPDGSVVWVNVHLAPLKVGKQNAMKHLCIVEDVTEQIKAEEALRESDRIKGMLLANLPGVVYRCAYDREWTMQFVSEGCFALTGYKAEELLQNRECSYNDLIPPEYRDLLWEKWTRVLETKTDFQAKYPITTAASERKWVLEKGHGVYDEKGEVEALEGLLIDITDLKKQEDEIRFLNAHDVLTGLYNRRYFEDAKEQLDRKSNLPLSVIIGDLDGLKIINNSFGHSEGDQTIIAIAKILSSCCREGDLLARTGGDEFTIILPKTGNGQATKLMKQMETACQNYRINSKIGAVSISLGCATKTEFAEPILRVIKVAEDNMFRHKMLQTESFHSSIIASLKTTLFEKSQETEAHAQRLIRLSEKIGKKMELSSEKLDELKLFSVLHDIGKIGISDRILNKPGALTTAEWVEMKKHSEIGYRIARSIPELVPIADYILSHHERWDGNGYPQGLEGRDIPLLARILAVVDSYDAMTQDRLYRKALPKEVAIDEIRKNRGKQFDPEIVPIFLAEI